MNKKHRDILLILLSLSILFLFFLNNHIVAASVIDTLEIFISKVFPFLFASMVINSFLIEINLPFYISKYLSFEYYVFLMSLLGGCPSNALIIKKLLDTNDINVKNASYALCYTTINNPLFLYFNLSTILNVKLAIKIMIIIYLSNFLIMLVCRYKCPSRRINIAVKQKNIKDALNQSISNSFITLLNVLGTFTFYKLICDVIFQSPNNLALLLKGLIEITQGLSLIRLAKLKSIIKELLIIVILSFSGLSIHMQIANILGEHNINYKYFYFSRFVLMTLGIVLILICK